VEFRPLTSDNSDFLPEEPLGESLLDLNTPPLRVWVPKKPVIVLGISQKPEREIHLDRSRGDGIPVFRRRGGGGCVVLDEGCVCIAMRQPRRDDLNLTHHLAHSSRVIQEVLNRHWDLEVKIEENHDLTLHGRKFLGCSLYMPRDYALYLCVILVKRSSLDRIRRYLPMPSRLPSHRAARGHDDFLIPLEDAGVESPEELRTSLDRQLTARKAWQLPVNPNTTG
jgi:lipoate-protein ligase A